MVNFEHQKFYSKFHTEKHYNRTIAFMQNIRVRMIKRSLIDATGNVLVVGCGSEHDMGVIPGSCEGVGLDISPEAIEASRKHYPRFSYSVADVSSMPFPDKSFDFVVFSETLEHVENKDAALNEVRRVLKDEGVLLLTLPNWLSWYGLARAVAEFIFKRPFTAADQPIDNWAIPWQMNSDLVRHKFRVTRTLGIWYFPPFGRGRRQIPSVITFPIVIILYPLEWLCERLAPWFGHAIFFTAVAK
jgi:SAM-dependent methyltransferase